MTLRDDVIAAGLSHLGAPYGMPPGPGEFDCSWFTWTALNEAGAGFPRSVRTAEAQRQASIPIRRDELLPGDLVFFQRTYDATESPGPDGLLATHLGIYLSPGWMLDANDARGNVGRTNYDTDWWRPHWLAAGRPPALAGVAPPKEPPVPPVATLPRGVDVASYQGNPDWSAVAGSGIAFAFTKVSEDDDYTNPTFARNWSEIRAAGLARGAYHFARPDSATDAVAEADYFLSRLASVGGLADGDLLALDLEAGSGDLGQWALDWLQHIEQRVGFKPLVYTGAWFSGPHNLAAYPALADYGLWLASYQGAMPTPPAPWELVAFWQYSDKGAVPGIAGNVDLNMFNGPADRIRLYGKTAGAPPVEPPPPPPSSLLADYDALVADVDARLAAFRAKIPA